MTPRNKRGINWLAVLVLEGLFLLLLSYTQLNAEPGGLLGLGRRTLGGGFTFSDEVVYQNWRIQKNAVIGHYRLIDAEDRIVTIGSYEKCLGELEQAKIEQAIAPLPKDVVIVMHGLGASRKWMNGLSKYLEDEGGLHVVNVGYPSTMGQIGEHAATLTNVIKHLDGVESVSFVAHSMGNIVIRHCLADMAALPPSEQPQITYKRFVMIAPPNHGAGMADTVGEKKILAQLAEMVGGEAVDQLAPNKGWSTLEPRLATPSFEFGIIVGGQGDNEGYLDDLPGDDDMLLTVETSKLVGASDFVQVKGIHQTLPKNEQVHSYTLRFLETGAFLPSRRKHPITASDVKVVAER